MKLSRALPAGALLALSAAAMPAYAAIEVFTASLSGANESPVNSSPGIGLAVVTVDTVTDLMHVQIAFSGLQGTTTASHIHCCTTAPNTGTAGVATTTPTFVGFPLGVTSGVYDATFDMSLASSWNPAFLTTFPTNVPQFSQTTLAFAALVEAMNANETYLNIHTSVVPGGEIRGFLHLASAVPEPESYALMMAGLAAVGFVARKRRQA